MQHLLQWFRHQRWWGGFVAIVAVMIAGCGLLQPHTSSLANGNKRVNRNELRMEYAAAVAGLKAREAALGAEKESIIETYGLAFEDLDTKEAQQREMIDTVVPLAGPLMGPYGSLLLPAISVLFGGAALGDKGRMNRALAIHNAKAGLTPDGLQPTSS